MAAVGGFWAEEKHYYIWQKILIRLYEQPLVNGSWRLWEELHRYPACLVLYAAGLGAVEANQLNFLWQLFSLSITRANHRNSVAIQVLPPFRFFDNSDTAKLLEGKERNYCPLNDKIYEVLGHYFSEIIANENRFALTFDKLEILMALSFAYHGKRTAENYWTLPGAYGYRNDNLEKIINEISSSLNKDGETSPYVTSHIFGETVQICSDNLMAFRDFASTLCSRWAW